MEGWGVGDTHFTGSHIGGIHISLGICVRGYTYHGDTHITVTPATEIEAYMKMTQGSTSMWSLIFQGFLTRFFKELTRQISQTKVDEEIVEQHIVVVDQTMCLLRIPRDSPRDSSSNINAYDEETLGNLSSAFSDVLSAPHQCLARAVVSPTTIV